jgi:hypothetical protein
MRKGEDRGQRSGVRKKRKKEVRKRKRKWAGLMRINSAKGLVVYKEAYALAMQIFELSKLFPAEENMH